MPFLIDPPDWSAPTKEWQEHLAQLRALPQDDISVKVATEGAQQELAKREKAAPGARWWDD
jgi:hypothetical protein